MKGNRTMKTRTTIAAALAIAIAFTAPATATSMFSAADKLKTREIQLRMTGKSEAEAKACVDKAWQEALEITGKGAGRILSIDDVLDAFLDKECPYPPKY